MSVLIKGMDMPKDCSGCCISFAMEGHYCQAVLEPNDAVEGGMAWKETLVNERPSWCPLVELPEKHGRLVEAEIVWREFTNAILDESQKTQCIRATSNEIWDVLRKVPTIIEAEGEV